MNKKYKKTIFKRLSKKDFVPSSIAEVGVYLPETSNVYDYIKMGIKCTLVEPDPKSINLIKTFFADCKNVTLCPVAIYDYSGQVELIQRDASTFISKLPHSPAKINDGYKMDKKDSFLTEAKTFDEIDDGAIDLLSADIEGGEWFVIKHMASRPTVISLETHGAAYINPYLDKIMNWMKINNYRILYKDKTDTVFVNNKITIGILDRIELFFMNIYLILRRQEKRLRKIKFKDKFFRP